MGTGHVAILKGNLTEWLLGPAGLPMPVGCSELTRGAGLCLYGKVALLPGGAKYQLQRRRDCVDILTDPVAYGDIGAPPLLSMVRMRPDMVELATDWLGASKVYYTKTDQGLVASSSLRWLSEWLGRRADISAWCDIAVQDQGFAPLGVATYVPDVQILPEQGRLTYRNGQLTLQGGADLTAVMAPDLTPAQIEDRLEEVVADLLAWRARHSDRPLFLGSSAGFDSRVLAALFRPQGIRNLALYTYPRNPPFDALVSRAMGAVLRAPVHRLSLRMTDPSLDALTQFARQKDVMARPYSTVLDLAVERALTPVLPPEAEILSGNGGDVEWGRKAFRKVFLADDPATALAEKIVSGTTSLLRDEYVQDLTARVRAALIEKYPFDDPTRYDRVERALFFHERVRVMQSDTRSCGRTIHMPFLARSFVDLALTVPDALTDKGQQGSLHHRLTERLGGRAFAMIPTLRERDWPQSRIAHLADRAMSSSYYRLRRRNRHSDTNRALRAASAASLLKTLAPRIRDAQSSGLWTCLDRTRVEAGLQAGTLDEKDQAFLVNAAAVLDGVI